MKRMNSTSFQGLENQKTLGKLFGKRKKKKFKDTQKSMWKNCLCKDELEKIDVLVDWIDYQMQSKDLLL